MSKINLPSEFIETQTPLAHDLYKLGDDGQITEQEWELLASKYVSNKRQAADFDTLRQNLEDDYRLVLDETPNRFKKLIFKQGQYKQGLFSPNWTTTAISLQSDRIELLMSDGFQPEDRAFAESIKPALILGMTMHNAYREIYMQLILTPELITDMTEGRFDSLFDRLDSEGIHEYTQSVLLWDILFDRIEGVNLTPEIKMVLLDIRETKFNPRSQAETTNMTRLGIALQSKDPEFAKLAWDTVDFDLNSGDGVANTIYAISDLKGFGIQNTTSNVVTGVLDLIEHNGFEHCFLDAQTVSRVAHHTGMKNHDLVLKHGHTVIGLLTEIANQVDLPQAERAQAMLTQFSASHANSYNLFTSWKESSESRVQYRG